MTRTKRSLVLLPLLILFTPPAASAKWKQYRAGKVADHQVTPRGGFALMGGGEHLEPAFRFLCERANGGDFLVLRASGKDDYNSYIHGFCPLNSVTTIVFSDRESASDPRVLRIIERSESIFIAGGDQSRYVRFWQGTPAPPLLEGVGGRYFADCNEAEFLPDGERDMAKVARYALNPESAERLWDESLRLLSDAG